MHLATLELLQWYHSDYQLRNRYIQPNRIVFIRKRFVHSNFDHSNCCQSGVAEHCRALQSTSSYLYSVYNTSWNILISIYVSFADTVHRSVAIDCNQLFHIQCLLFSMVQGAGIRMDATILFGLHHLFQLARPHSDSIHCHEWIISKKGEQTIDQT